MNEPRSQAELYITQRKTTDGSKIYNISYNPADDLQSWIEDMAAYIKGIDPIHLLSTGVCHLFSDVSASSCSISRTCVAHSCMEEVHMGLPLIWSLPTDYLSRAEHGFYNVQVRRVSQETQPPCTCSPTPEHGPPSWV